MLVEEEEAERFRRPYGHLLAYVNNQFNLIDGVETYNDVTQRALKELRPIRDGLYEHDTEEIISRFAAENPADLPPDDLATIEKWKDYRFGEFLVVRHLKRYAVFLDWKEPPKAFGVKAVWNPFTAFWRENDLPVMLTDTVLLPFEETIVTDTWMAMPQIILGKNYSESINDAYEEAKHRFGIIENLPSPQETEKTEAENLRFYMKNKRNREQYREEIQQLKNKNHELEQIYHQELGKARARSLGRELRNLDLNEAYFAIYEDRIIASGTTKNQDQKILDNLMPPGKEKHPYIYHYNP